MLTKIIRLLKSYVYVELIGNQPERFFNLCRHNKIYVWNYTNENNKIYFYILTKDYIKLSNIVLKTKTYPHIVKRIGLPFIIGQLLKQTSLLPALILYITIIYILSLCVWNISFSGQSRHTSSELRKFLNDENIAIGMLRSDINGNEIERLIRNHFDDISWVSVELSGCNVNIKIVESDIMEDKSNLKYLNSDIIASSDGTVESIITRKGTPKVKCGDTVKKGQVLVSGIIPIYDDGGTIIDNKLVYADGDIILNTVHSYKDMFPVIYEDKQYTGRYKYEFKVYCDNKIFFIENLLNKIETYEKYDIINECFEIFGYNKFCGQTGIVRCKQQEYEIIYKSYSKEQALHIARLHLNNYIKKLRDKDIIIKDKKISLSLYKNNYIADGYLHIMEPQLLRREISTSDWSVDNQDGNDGEDN